MTEDTKNCEHLWETYRTESFIGRKDSRYSPTTTIAEVKEVFCKKCLQIKKL